MVFRVVPNLAHWKGAPRGSTNRSPAVLLGGTSNNFHKGMLCNALIYALAVDALQNNAPADVAPVDTTLRPRFARERLDFGEYSRVTHGAIVFALVELLLGPNVVSKPETRPYAL